MKPKNIEDSLKDLYKRFSKSKTKASVLINDKEKAKKRSMKRLKRRLQTRRIYKVSGLN